MRDFVLDTGALVALQRDRSRLLSLVERARERELELRTCAPVLTEFLGGSPRRLRNAAEFVASRVRVSPVDEVFARRAATLRQKAVDGSPRSSPSAIDALVATQAELDRALLVIDGDRGDFDALAEASGAFEVRDLASVR